MSNFLGANSGVGGSAMLTATDERAKPIRDRWNDAGRRTLASWDEGALWSRSRFAGQSGQFFADDMSNTAGYWDARDLDESGGQQAKKLIGTTRDASGNPLGSAIVQGFVTSSDAYVGQVVSDTGGYFELPTSAGAVAHYLVAYKAAGPDIAGTTVNTLVPV